MAAIAALEALKEHCEVTLSTTVNMCGKELPNGFITEAETRLENSGKETRKNVDSGNVRCCVRSASDQMGMGQRPCRPSRKTSVVMNWRRAAAMNPTQEDSGYRGGRPAIRFAILPGGANGLADRGFTFIMSRIKRKCISRWRQYAVNSPARYAQV